MACDFEGHGQAEEHTQVSLQQAVGALIGLHPTESVQNKTRALSSAGSTFHAGSADTIDVDALSSQRTACCFPPVHGELPNTFVHADAVKQAAEGANPHGLCTNLSFVGPALDMNGLLRGRPDVAADTDLCAPLSNMQSEKSVKMTSAGGPHSGIAEIAEEAATTLAVCSLDKSSEATSSTLVNPCSKFAAPDDDAGFTRHTTPAGPRYENVYSTVPTSREQQSDNVDNRCSGSGLLNDHVAQNRSAINHGELHDEENKMVAAGSPAIPRRPPIDPSNKIFQGTSNVTPVDRGAKLGDTADLQPGFFNGIHPSRLTMISHRNAPMLGEIKSQMRGGNAENTQTVAVSGHSTPATSQLASKTRKKKTKSRKKNMSERPLQDMGEKPAWSSKAGQHDLKIEGAVSGAFSPIHGLRHLSEVGVQFAIEGIESLKKRYTHLHRFLALGKEWFFAWQEIAAVLRTHYSYDYVSWRSGFSTQLSTDFKVFRLRGPFKNKSEGKYMTSKRAVLHVLDGPYFYKQAAPALAEFCLVNGLAAPKYRHYLHPDGTWACSVRVGNKSSVFGDDEEGYISRTDAEEDVAKTAMNALHRGGMLMGLGAATDAAGAMLQCRSEPENLKKRKAPGSSSGKQDYTATFSRAKRNDASEAPDPIGLVYNDENRGASEAGSGADGDFHQFDNDVSFGFRDTSARTRAGLAQALNGVLGPLQRVKVMCEYLMLSAPEYWMEEHPGSRKWSARLLSSHNCEGSAHSPIPSTTMTSFNGVQDCAKLVEENLLEEIYGGDIRLGEGDASSLDPAMQDERLSRGFARSHPRTKQCLEVDQGPIREEISQRVESADKSLKLPPVNHTPLAAAQDNDKNDEVVFVGKRLVEERGFQPA